jgi:HK97 family phage major capsid protein
MKRTQGQRIITRGVLDMATLQWDRTQEESYLYHGPMALADEAENGEKLKAAIEKALGKHFDTVKVVIDKTAEDVKTFGKIQESTKEAVDKLNKDGGKLMGEFADYKADNERRIVLLEQKIATGLTGGRKGPPKSIGQQYIESEEFKNFVPIGKGTGKHMSRPFQLKTITSLAGSAGEGITPEYLPTVVVPYLQNLTVRDLLAGGTTGTDLIYWVKENVFTNNAGVVSEGALKPQSDITYSRLNVPVTTIAHWIKASKQVLADFQQLAALIDARLNFGLKLTEEHELLFGDGTGEHLQGIVPQATPYSGAFAKATDTFIDVIRHAILQVRLAFYPASGAVMSPVDWHNIELTKDSQDRYILAQPMGSIPAMIWGLPVVQSDSMHVGDFLVGAFKLAAMLFDREQAQILVSTEDQDDFVRNLVTILCEERLALAVTRPAAFVYGNFPAGTST